MAKKTIKPGCMAMPVPAVLVSCADKEGKENLLTVAWTGVVSSEPPTVYISIRKERFSYHMIVESGEFVINLPSKEMVRAVDACGFKSGKNTDKWEASGLTKAAAAEVGASVVAECPVNIECRVKQVLPMGSHDMILAEIVAVQADEKCLDEQGNFAPEKADLVSYAHQTYFALGDVLGKYGFSIRKKTLNGRQKATGKAALPVKKED